MPTNRVLPARPDLGHLKRQAEDLREAFAAGDPTAKARVHDVAPLRHLVAGLLGLSIAQAQLVIAREYGFKSWAELKVHVETTRAASPAEQASGAAARPAESATDESPKDPGFPESIPGEGDLEITSPVEHRSIVSGNVCVRAGGKLTLLAPCGGTITVMAGGTADLRAPVGGTVVIETGGTCSSVGPVGGTFVNSGTLSVSGPVGGSIHARAGHASIGSIHIGGDLIVEPGATVACSGTVSGQVINHGGTLEMLAAAPGAAGPAGLPAGVHLDWLGPMLTSVLGGVGKTLGGPIGGAVGGALGGGLHKLQALEGLSEMEMLSELGALSSLSVMETLRGSPTGASRPVEAKMKESLAEMGRLTGEFTAKVQAAAGRRVEAKSTAMSGSPGAVEAAARLNAEADVLKAEARAIMARVRAALAEAVRLAEEAANLRQVPA